MSGFILIVLGFVIVIMLTPKPAQNEGPDYDNWSSVLAVIDSLAMQNKLAGIPPKLIKSVATLETGSGEEPLIRKTNNIFNIHAAGPANEYWSGAQQWSSGDNAFMRVYSSIENSVLDFVRLMQTTHYNGAYMAAVQNNSNRFFAALESAGYSTQRGYGEDLQAIYQNKFA